MNTTDTDLSSSTTSATVLLEKTMQMMGLDGDSSNDGNISMDNLYPALIQCFTVIICGLS
uniref:CSON004236 protein n=1 Tax=Culicoides sonorensis TaxID=179676 RepID=A0A336MUI5_CULSO